MQRQITAAVLTVALVFLVIWVIPNQLLTVFLIKYSGTNDGAALKMRATLLLGIIIEEQSISTANSLAAATAQLNSCLNFFIYAFRHDKFRQHLRLICGGEKDSLKASIAVPSAKVGTLPPLTERE